MGQPLLLSTMTQTCRFGFFDAAKQSERGDGRKGLAYQTMEGSRRVAETFWPRP
jgi:hypothetical protein